MKALRLAGVMLAFWLCATASAQQAPATKPASDAGAGQIPGLGSLGNFESGLGGTGGGDLTSAGGPVEIDASDGIEWRRDENVYIARGNAHVARGDTSVSADSLIAHYRSDADGKTTVYMVEAVGNVVMISKDARIVGDKAVYNLENGGAVITGRNLKASSKDQFVTARDSLEYWEKQGAVVARGDALATDGNQQVRADLLTGYFHIGPSGSKKIYQLEATGNVRITAQGSLARATKAIYNLETNIATLEGGVKITRGKNQLNGERAVYNLKNGLAKITGGGSQVKTLLVPGSDSNQPLGLPGGDLGKSLTP